MEKSRGSIKCVVWDLDDTLWNGVLLEDSSVTLKTGMEELIRTLDGRGILQSIASKNHHEDAVRALAHFNLREYFLYPQIHWNSKVQSIRDIAKSMNIGMDSIAFVDDSPAELDEVAFSLPEVLCIPAEKIPRIPHMPCMVPKFVTEDQKNRRRMYLAGMDRDEAEKEFAGPREDFLAGLGMTLTIFPAGEADLQRAEELTVRTNQLNATGYTYSHEELKHFSTSPDHMLLMARLTDRYGSYGHIGLALLNCEPARWVIKLLLMSCRVMSRGVGSVMLIHLIRSARERNVKLQAEFVPNDRNRMMNVAYRFAGFQEMENKNGRVMLRHPLTDIPSFPDYMDVIVE